MYLDKFECTWSAVTVILKDGNITKEYIMERPCQMWDFDFDGFVPYYPLDAHKAFQNSIGDDIEVICRPNYEPGIARVTFTRSDCFPLAVIKFKMEE